jgi:hypothetical protein
MSDEPNPYAAPGSDTNPLAEPPAKRTAWKVYALAVLALQGVGFVAGLRDMGRTEVLDFAMTTVGIVGLLGFAFRRRVLVRAVWRVWSIVLPLWDAALGVWVYPSHAKPGWTTAYLMAMVLFVPEYLALLWYAYRSDEIWSRGTEP